MPAPMPALLYLSARYGAPVLAGYAAARVLPGLRDRWRKADPRIETAHDLAEPGIRLQTTSNSISASWGWQRIFGLDPNGPGYKVEATLLARLRIKSIRVGKANK